MSGSSLTESVVEEAALEWLESLGYAIRNGPAIAPGELGAERADYAQAVLEDRLGQALARLNPALPPEATEDALRKLMRTDPPSLVERNRAVQRMLVDSVTSDQAKPHSRRPAGTAAAPAHLRRAPGECCRANRHEGAMIGPHGGNTCMC